MIEFHPMIAVFNFQKVKSRRPASKKELVLLTTQSSNGEKRDNNQCTFFMKPRHTKGKYLKLCGKPNTFSEEWGYKNNS